MAKPISSKKDERQARIDNAFSVFPPEQAAQLRAMAQYRCWRNGEIVMRRGEPAPYVLTILSGRMRVSATTDWGQEAFFRWYLPGEIIGLVSAVGNLPWPVDAVALDDCETLMVGRQDFFESLLRSAELGIVVGQLLALHVWQTVNLVTMRTAPTLTGRVFGVLVHLARMSGIVSANGDWTLTISQKDIAEAVGASRQRVNVELCMLERKGSLSLGYGKVILHACKERDAAVASSGLSDFSLD